MGRQRRRWCLDGGSEGTSSYWVSLLVFDILLLALLILATRGATLLHEGIGHGLIASLMGGRVNGIQITLFGGGHTYYHLDLSPLHSGPFLVSFGGIMVNLISGTVALIFSRRSKSHPIWAMFLILFGMVSLLGATGYAALGFYYQQGDPVSWLDKVSRDSNLLWIPFLLLSPLVSYVALKAYTRLLQVPHARGTFPGRVGGVIVTLGFAVCAYVLLYGTTRQSSTALDAPLLAYLEAEREVRDVKKAALFRLLCEVYPGLSDEEIKALVEEIPVPVRPEEVPRKFPLTPILAILYVIGGLMGVFGVKNITQYPLSWVAPRTGLFIAGITSLVLAYIAFTDGWIYRP